MLGLGRPRITSPTVAPCLRLLFDTVTHKADHLSKTYLSLLCSLGGSEVVADRSESTLSSQKLYNRGLMFALLSLFVLFPFCTQPPSANSPFHLHLQLVLPPPYFSAFPSILQHSLTDNQPFRFQMF